MGHIPDPKRFEKRIKKEIKKDWKKLHGLEKEAHALTKDKLDFIEKKYNSVISRVEGIVQKARELKNIIPS